MNDLSLRKWLCRDYSAEYDQIVETKCSRGIRVNRKWLIWVVFSFLPLPALALDVGDAAPDFELAGSDGGSHKLSDLRGQYVVLAFFPKAYTSG